MNKGGLDWKQDKSWIETNSFQHTVEKKWMVDKDWTGLEGKTKLGRDKKLYPNV